jgi:hypothetical protein
LEAFIHVAYGHAALAYNAAGNPLRAQEYAMLANAALGLGEGFGESNPRKWQDLIENF